ncbi:dienelactone hydrolase [Bowmanella sp. Y26]|nr:dienelactone hydrolase [Bowmanella yangjiangensis]
MLEKVTKASLLILSCIAFGSCASEGILDVKNEKFVGKYYPPSSLEKSVGVLVLGGAEGGIPEKLAKAVVDAGYPTLALAYFNAKGLPQELEKIPLEYFDSAKSWLQAQKNVDSGKLIIVGWSKGAELALLLASRDEKIQQIIAIAPSSVVWAGILKDWTKVPASSWTEQGQELTHVEFKPSGAVSGLLDLYTQSLENRSENGEADILVENIKGNVVLMTGENDEIWPSPQMAKLICERMNKRQDGQCQHLNFNGLDHLLNYKFLDKSDPLGQTFIDKLNGG